MTGRKSSGENSVRVMVVDDNPFDAELIEMALKASLNCSVVTVDTKHDFLMELERAVPNVIVADSNLPMFDGMTAFALAKAQCPEVPFLFCTGPVPEAIKLKALALGAKAWLSKDDLDEFVLTVRRLCGES